MDAAKTTDQSPKIISDRLIRRKPTPYPTGPMIERVQVIEFNGERTTVNFWYQNGKLVRVS